MKDDLSRGKVMVIYEDLIDDKSGKKSEKEKIDIWELSTVISNLVCVFIILLSIFCFFYRYDKTHQTSYEILSNWEKVSAVITAIDSKRSYHNGQKYHTDYTVTYQFDNPDGHSVTIAQNTTYYCPYSIGDKIDIYYNPNAWYESVIADDL